MTDDGGDVILHTVGADDDGQRLDAVLARVVPQLSRSRIQALIRDGHVRHGGRTIGECSVRVKRGDVVDIRVPAPVPAEPRAQVMSLDVVYEDADLIVIDKPAGIVVHPSAGHESGTLVNALIAHCGDSLSGIGGVRRPGIVHRLDKDTSGLLVVAKTDAAHRGLAEQFAAHGRDGRLHRAYFGVCWRVPDRNIGTIDAPLARSEHNRTRIAVSTATTAREAITHYEVMETFLGPVPPTTTGVRPRSRSRSATALRVAATPPAVAALLKLQLETGRTHQIRVHLAHIGHPLLGDKAYGAGFKSSVALLPVAAAVALEALDRQALHAAELGFDHPRTGESLSFDSPLPEDLARLIAKLRAPVLL